MFRTAKGHLKRILFVGNDFSRKGSQELIEVFLERFRDEAELHLVTNAPINSDRPAIHVHCKVEAHSPEWLSLHASASLFVLPTRHDASPLAVIEAMAADLPKITTNINAIPELVADGKKGLLAEPLNQDSLAQSLTSLLNDSGLSPQMGMDGRKLAAEKCGAKRNSEHLETVFARAAASSGGKPHSL
jgi:alpha-maltose-1-phosphate synthase